LFQNVGERNYYSLGVKASQIFKSFPERIENKRKYLQIGDTYIPKYNKTTALLNYFGPSGYFAHYDFADVIDDETFELQTLDLNSYNDLLKKEVFKNKIVLVGVTAVEFHDVHPTPFFIKTKTLMPGVEIHATFIEMFIQKKFLKNISYLLFVLILFLLSIVYFFITTYVSPNKSVYIVLISVLSYLGLSFYLFSSKDIILPILQIPFLLIFIYVVSLIYHYIKTVKERKFIKDAFERYLAPNLVQELLKSPGKLHYGGEQKEITVLFSDIRSFTPYTESHSPKETVMILQEYLTAMVGVIIKNKGTLDKFVGDEIMALFGVPVELDNSAYWACKAAYEMRLKLKELHKKWEAEGKDTFEIGIGINTGFATVGNLGSEQIFDYTAIGDTVNAGARLEAINKQYDTENHIIISESTYKMAKDKIIAEYLDDVLVKGKSIPVKIYQLLGIKE
jgi:adenylate cyclase